MTDKLGRKRKGTFAKTPRSYGNKKRMKAKYDGTCAICKERYSAGLEVLYDETKPAGKKCAHISCYLRAQEK